MRQRIQALGLLALLALFGCGDPPTPEPTAGFAGLGAEGEGFAQALPGMPLHFPEDHGAHPDYRIEWWYLTANLEDETGEPMGLQWTLFRQALTPLSERPDPGPWVADQLWMAHLAVSRGERHAVAERFARGHSRATSGQAGVNVDPFRAWIDDWRLESRVTEASRDSLSRLELEAMAEADGDAFGYRLTLEAEGPLVLHGEAGFSQKAANGQGSVYVSQPFYRVAGEVTLEGETHEVTGRGWLDREWSSQLLGSDQTGWDWFSLHMNDGHKLMAFRLRGSGEDGGNYLSGTWITPEGKPQALAPNELTLTPLSTSNVAGREVPTRWRLEVPVAGLDLIVQAPHANRWMATSVPYWEGQVIASDYESNEQLGIGYLEMTGY